MLRKMLTGYFVCFLILLQTLNLGSCSSLLCGRTKELEVGSGVGVGAALALALVRPASDTKRNQTSCELNLVAPDAAAFTVRLIDVKESMMDWERGTGGLQAPSKMAGAPERKWSARTTTHVQDTSTDQTVSRSNNTDACRLSIYIGESKMPIWTLSLCGSNAAAIASRAGTKLLPPKMKIVWNPPTTPYQHTEKLRLVVTAVNSGVICNNDSQFSCGSTSLCVSSFLVCDGVRHCPGGEDEDAAACSHRKEPPFLELLRRFAARNQEFLGIDNSDHDKPSVISDLTLPVKIGEADQKPNPWKEFAAGLQSNGPWGYFIAGMFICTTILIFCMAYECCCKRSKPTDTTITIPPACMDLSPTVSVTAASQHVLMHSPPSTPEYEPPPSYSSLFPRAYKSSPTPVPHCSHQEPPD